MNQRPIDAGIHQAITTAIRPAPDLAPGESGTVPIAAIAPDPRQPRQSAASFGDITDLADSIRRHGIVQPLIVSRQPTTMVGDPNDVRPYKIVAGERRWRAAELAGLTHVPVICRAADAAELAACALIENIHRRDLNPLEVAEHLERMIIDHHFTHEELGATIGIKRERVTRYLGLLKLEPGAKEALRAGRLSQAHVEPLIGLDDKIVGLIAYAAVQEHWTRDQVRQVATTWAGLSADASATASAIIYAETPLGKGATTASPTLRRLTSVALPRDIIVRLNQIAGNAMAFEKTLRGALDDAERAAKGQAPSGTGMKSRIRSAQTIDPDTKTLVDSLRAMMATDVTIIPATPRIGRSKPSAGQLTISFWSNEELDGIIDRLRRAWGYEDT